MTLREHEHQRARRKQVARKQVAKRPSALDAPFAMANDAQVLTFFEWCKLNRLSERTGRRVLRSGTGPKVVQLSAKRIGITIGANKRWQASRERG